MRAVDTNVIARLLLRDDADQAARAEALLSEPLWIGMTVWLELGWVLNSRTGLGRAAVADALAALLTFDTVRTADHDGLIWAIARFREGADWGDLMHLVDVRHTADLFVTFDKALGRAAGPSAPIAIETLP